MADQLDIYVTSRMQQRMVRPVFDLTDRFWPTLAIISIPIVIYLDSTVTVAQGRFQGSVGPAGGLYAASVAIAAGARWLERRRSRRHLADQSHQHEQYLAIDHQGIRYGWEGLAHYAIAWKAVSSVEWHGRTLELLMGRQRLSVDLRELPSEQRDDLRAFLTSLRDGKSLCPAGADASSLPIGGPQRIVLKG